MKIMSNHRGSLAWRMQEKRKSKDSTLAGLFTIPDS